MAFHSKEALVAEINRLSPAQLEAGVIIDSPRARRQMEKAGRKPFRITLPPDLQARLVTEVERRVDGHGKMVGYQMIIERLEEETNEQILERAGGD